MDFVKMHGLGNDFLLVEAERDPPARAGAWARALCDRHFGVGADGLVFVLPSERADVRMRIFNADGSEAEQCGNAIRCVAKYAYESGLVRKDRLTVETIGAGPQILDLTIEDGRVRNVRVDMGRPELRPDRIPVAAEGQRAVDLPLSVEGHSFRFTAVSMGNPHCVIFVDDALKADVYKWGPLIERHPMFPNRTNVEFVSVRSREHLDMRVWERGAGPTLACGTGACASLVAAAVGGRTGREAAVSLAGGDLWIEWDEQSDRVYMTGPAETVYRGAVFPHFLEGKR